MSTKLSNIQFAKPFIIEGRRPAIATESKDIYNHLRFHIDGYKHQPDKIDNPYFDHLIKARRPNESEHVLAYREKNYLPKTKQPCFKVLNSLKKIVKSQDWNIDYSTAENPGVVGDETLQQYCEQKYPFFNSLENWLYSSGTKNVISDPNGLFYVEPKTWDIKDGEKYEPIVKFCKTPDVYAYKVGEYALFLSEHVNTVRDGDVTRDLPIYILMTPTSFVFIIENDIERTLIEDVKSNTMAGLYAFKSGGVLKDVIRGEAIYNSFIDPMLPSLDAVAGESSDLQAEVVQNIYSTMWYVAGSDCKQCQGTGLISGGAGFNKNGQQTACPKCEGSGRMLKSPFKDMVVPRESLGDGGIPTPPGGYIQKTTDIVKLQDERIANHIFDALASLNMEFLAQVPTNQSGVAKEVDRDELNNFVYGVAYHLVENVLKRVYVMVNDMRYGVLVKDTKTREQMLPSINVPEKYDLLSTNTMIDNFKKVTESGIDNSIRDEYEVDIINKTFKSQPDVKRKLLLIKDLDPLRGIMDEEKTTLWQNNMITKDDYVLSTYINVFIDQLLAEDPGFAELETKKQKEMLDVLTKTKIVDEKEQINQLILGNEPPKPE